MPENVKITFDLDTESTDKARSIVSNVDRTSMFSWKEIKTINNSDIYDTYNDPYLSKKENAASRSKKAVLRYKVWEWFESPGRYAKTDDAAMTVSTQGNKIRKTFGR